MAFHYEKRRYPRIWDPVCAWISFQKDSAAYGTLTLDLGPEGARFSTLREVEAGAKLLIAIQLHSSTIECKGKVCWTDSAPDGLVCFGVRFLDLSETERALLEEFVLRHTALSVAL
jgi:hypothetical protein